MREGGAVDEGGGRCCGVDIWVPSICQVPLGSLSSWIGQRRQLQFFGVVAHRSNYLGMRPALVRYLAGNQLPENHAKAVHVSSFGVGITAEDLRSHPVRGAHLAVVVSDELLLVAGEAEIADLDRPVIREQYILALEVAMEYLL